jgi:anion-transporting  ArsA/GET3 family ATPase
MTPPLDQRRFLFVTGKGGVGKTAVAAALAVSLAEAGKRVLLTSCDMKERFSTLFGKPALTSEISELGERIWGVKLEAEAALREYGGMVLKSEKLFDVVFDNRYTHGFFAGVPGLYEWAMLGKAWFHTTEKRKDGSKRFDVVLFDAPATGHGLDMLRVPKVIVDVVPPGLLRQEAERAWTMFQDAKVSGIVVVTLPEDMPTNETIELIDALDNELSLPIAKLVVNAVTEPMFSAEERAELLRDRRIDRSQPGDEAIAAGVRRAIRERVEADALERLGRLGKPQVELPLLRADVRDLNDIRRLAAFLS